MDIKSFNTNSNPSFDIANFESFLKRTYDEPTNLFADYFIFEYEPNVENKDYSFTIKEIYLKKIWEIIGTDYKKDQTHPITLQEKKKRPYAIRPFNFRNESLSKNRTNGLKSLIKKVKQTGKSYGSFSNNGIPSSDVWENKIMKCIDNQN